MRVKIYNKYGIIKNEYDDYCDFSESLHNAEKMFLKHYVIVSYNLKRSKDKYKQVLYLRSKYRKDLFNMDDIYDANIIDNKVIIEITKN